MSLLLRLVRIATMVLACVCLGDALRLLIENSSNRWVDVGHNSWTAAALALMVFGVYSAYENERAYLVAFALLLVVLIVVHLQVKPAAHNVLGVDIALVVLALVQAELLRYGTTLECC